MSIISPVPPTIGFATIGQTPRSDLVPWLTDRLRKPVIALEGGVLDGLGPDEIAGLDDGGSSQHMVTRLRNGGSARLSFPRTLPRMQAVVDALVEQGAELIVIVCGADWSAIRAPIPIINPGRVFPATVESLAGSARLGVIKPSAGQTAATAEGLRERGINAMVTSAFPYDDQRLAAAARAAAEFKEFGPQLVWMSCVGMDEDMHEVVVNELRRPVILARALLVDLINNLLT